MKTKTRYTEVATFISYNNLTDTWYKEVDGKQVEITDAKELKKLEHERIYGAYERSYY